jgi:hypothetical protein
MCFSAGASFGAGAVLSAVGVITLRSVRNRSQIPFASIPMLFALQQFAEGLVWLSLTNGHFSGWRSFSANLFLIFAQVLWPVWIPCAILLIEKNPKRRLLLRMLLGIGIALAGSLAYYMLTLPMKAQIINRHIDYTLNIPVVFTWISSILYFFSPVLPTFVSTTKRVYLLGIAIVISYLFTKVFYEAQLISVWCFFAALISVLVLYILVKLNEQPVYKLKVGM